MTSYFEVYKEHFHSWAPKKKETAHCPSSVFSFCVACLYVQNLVPLLSFTLYFYLTVQDEVVLK